MSRTLTFTRGPTAWAGPGNYLYIADIAPFIRCAYLNTPADMSDRFTFVGPFILIVDPAPRLDPLDASPVAC